MIPGMVGRCGRFTEYLPVFCFFVRHINICFTSALCYTRNAEVYSYFPFQVIYHFTNNTQVIQAGYRMVQRGSGPRKGVKQQERPHQIAVVIIVYNRSSNDHASSDYYSICPSKQSSVVYLVDACRFTIKHNWDLVRNAAGTAECSCLALRLRSREPRC